jgi:predicted Zn-dependent protease
MNKRLEMLEKMTASGQADAFAWYGLAMEYRREGRTDDALRTFDTLRSAHPDYLPMYLMAGQMLAELERYDAARPWLEQGIAVAREQGNSKAIGELEGVLAECE